MLGEHRTKKARGKVPRQSTCFGDILTGQTSSQAQKRAVGSGVRALASHARGQWFKSTTAHHYFEAILEFM